MKNKLLIVVFVLTLILTSCTTDAKDKNGEKDSENEASKTENVSKEDEGKEEKEEQQQVDYITSITYSNLVDEESKNEVIESLKVSGIAEENINLFIKFVDHYNNSVGDIGLVKEGFVVSENFEPAYDYEKMAENWENANPSFEEMNGNRNNCRMTTFLLANDLIHVDGEYVKDNKMLFMDNDTISFGMNEFFKEENIDRFNTFYGDVSTELVKDIGLHLEKVKDYWKGKHIIFKDSELSVITVWLHNELDNNLFVGHTGVLLPSKKDNKLLFIEKISFEEPYQALKFNNRRELNDYLMMKYDNNFNQPTARPFIMENGEILDGYRVNPKNVE